MSTRSTNGLLPLHSEFSQQRDVEAGGPTSDRKEDTYVEEGSGESDPFDIADTKNAPSETLKRWRQQDVEAGGPAFDGKEDAYDEEGRGDSDPFDIVDTKHAPVETLKRWRQKALVLNRSRRFRYTSDLKKDEKKEQIKRMIRDHPEVIRAALQDKEKKKEKIEWLLLSTGLILEVTSAIFEQLEYARLGVVMAFLGLMLCVADLACKARKERATFEWIEGSVPWIYSQSPRRKLFGTTVDYFGLVAGLGQLILSTLSYFYASKNLQNPIKMGVIMVLFFLCLLVSKVVKKYSRVDPRGEWNP